MVQKLRISSLHLIALLILLILITNGESKKARTSTTTAKIPVEKPKPTVKQVEEVPSSGKRHRFGSKSIYLPWMPPSKETISEPQPSMEHRVEAPRRRYRPTEKSTPVPWNRPMPLPPGSMDKSGYMVFVPYENEQQQQLQQPIDHRNNRLHQLKPQKFDLPAGHQIVNYTSSLYDKLIANNFARNRPSSRYGNSHETVGHGPVYSPRRYDQNRYRNGHLNMFETASGKPSSYEVMSHTTRRPFAIMSQNYRPDVFIPIPANPGYTNVVQDLRLPCPNCLLNRDNKVVNSEKVLSENVLPNDISGTSRDKVDLINVGANLNSEEIDHQTPEIRENSFTLPNPQGGKLASVYNIRGHSNHLYFLFPNSSEANLLKELEGQALKGHAPSENKTCLHNCMMPNKGSPNQKPGENPHQILSNSQTRHTFFSKYDQPIGEDGKSGKNVLKCDCKAITSNNKLQNNSQHNVQFQSAETAQAKALSLADFEARMLPIMKYIQDTQMLQRNESVKVTIPLPTDKPMPLVIPSTVKEHLVETPDVISTELSVLELINSEEIIESRLLNPVKKNKSFEEFLEGRI